MTGKVVTSRARRMLLPFRTGRAEEDTLIPPARQEHGTGGASPATALRRTTDLALAAIVLVSALIQLSPAVQSTLQFDRSAIAAGQAWRLVTGNFVHYDWHHLAANLGTFAALCWMASWRARGTLTVVVLSAVAVGAGVHCLADGIATYRGVSGVDCAILAWLLLTMAMQDRGRRRAAWIAVLLLVTARFTIELATGHVLLPTSAPPGVAVVGITHVIGLATGALGAALSSLRGAWKNSRCAVQAIPG